MTRKNNIRILVGKVGLDGHDRGAKVIARAFRDAGMEVIYTGLHQTPEQIVQAALQEDVEVVALSILSGAHMTLFPKVRKMLDNNDAADIMLVGGGTIPEDDIAALKAMGATKELFTPGAKLDDIINWVNNAVLEQRQLKYKG